MIVSLCLVILGEDVQGCMTNKHTSKHREKWWKHNSVKHVIYMFLMTLHFIWLYSTCGSAIPHVFASTQTNVPHGFCLMIIKTSSPRFTCFPTFPLQQYVIQSYQDYTKYKWQVGCLVKLRPVPLVRRNCSVTNQIMINRFVTGLFT